MVRGCQTCLRIIKDASGGLYINSISLYPDTTTLKEKLTDCVPELACTDLVQDATLCQSCITNLTAAYQFKQTCLTTQQKIYDYLEKIPVGNEIDIGKIAMYYYRFEVVPQEVEDTTSATDSSNIPNCRKMPYNCTESNCQFSCLDECFMRLHKILHKRKHPPYKCDQCAFIFPTSAYLLDHLSTHSNERPYSCTICDFVTSSHSQFKNHGWKHRKAFQCNFCWKRFTEENELDTHMAAHAFELASRRFQCGWCEYKCDTTKTLQSHSDQEHQNTFKCEICTVECRTRLALTLHTKSAHKDLVDAQHEVNVYEDLDPQPVITILDDKEDPVMSSKLKRADLRWNFTCDKCGDVFSGRRKMTKHYKTCTGSSEHIERRTSGFGTDGIARDSSTFYRSDSALCMLPQSPAIFSKANPGTPETPSIFAQAHHMIPRRPPIFPQPPPQINATNPHASAIFAQANRILPQIPAQACSILPHCTDRIYTLETTRTYVEQNASTTSNVEQVEVPEGNMQTPSGDLFDQNTIVEALNVKRKRPNIRVRMKRRRRNERLGRAEFVNINGQTSAIGKNQQFQCKFCSEILMSDNALNGHWQKKHRDAPQKNTQSTGNFHVIPQNPSVMPSPTIGGNNGNNPHQHLTMTSSGIGDKRKLEPANNTLNPIVLTLLPKLHRCLQCRETRTTLDSLRDHQRLMHGKVLYKTLDAKLYGCSHCSETSTTYREIRNHVRYHARMLKSNMVASDRVQELEETLESSENIDNNDFAPNIENNIQGEKLDLNDDQKIIILDEDVIMENDEVPILVLEETITPQSNHATTENIKGNIQIDGEQREELDVETLPKTNLLGENLQVKIDEVHVPNPEDNTGNRSENVTIKPHRDQNMEVDNKHRKEWVLNPFSNALINEEVRMKIDVPQIPSGNEKVVDPSENMDTNDFATDIDHNLKNNTHVDNEQGKEFDLNASQTTNIPENIPETPTESENSPHLSENAAIRDVPSDIDQNMENKIQVENEQGKELDVNDSSPDVDQNMETSIQACNEEGELNLGALQKTATIHEIVQMKNDIQQKLTGSEDNVPPSETVPIMDFPTDIDQNLKNNTQVDNEQGKELDLNASQTTNILPENILETPTGSENSSYLSENAAIRDVPSDIDQNLENKVQVDNEQGKELHVNDSSPYVVQNKEPSIQGCTEEGELNLGADMIYKLETTRTYVEQNAGTTSNVEQIKVPGGNIQTSSQDLFNKNTIAEVLKVKRKRPDMRERLKRRRENERLGRAEFVNISGQTSAIGKKQQFQCKFCSEILMSKGALKRHWQKKHRGTPQKKAQI